MVTVAVRAAPYENCNNPGQRVACYCLQECIYDAARYLSWVGWKMELTNVGHPFPNTTNAWINNNNVHNIRSVSSDVALTQMTQ